MTLTLVFRRTQNGNYAAYIEEMPELLTVRGNDLEQVRLDVFVELAQMLNYHAVEDEEVTLVTKHWLNYPMQDQWYTQEDWDKE